MALGAESGRSSFNVMGEFSSFLEPSISETRIFDGINKAAEVIDVGVSTLDLEVPGDARSIFLKMDTQGMITRCSRVRPSVSTELPSYRRK